VTAGKSRRLPRRALIAVGLSVVVVAGCGSDDSADWLPRYRGEVSGDSAALGGQIRVEGRCLYVGDWLPIFPRDSSYDEERGVLTVLGTEFRVGVDDFDSGGGESLALPGDLLVEPDPACDLSNVWIVGDVDPPVEDRRE
jgi:hypothetical protein